MLLHNIKLLFPKEHKTEYKIQRMKKNLFNMKLKNGRKKLIIIIELDKIKNLDFFD